MRKTARRALWSTRRPGPAGASIALALGLFAAPAMAASPPVSVTGQWMRFLTPQIPAAGYMTLRNGGSQPAVLTSAESPACGKLMLHRSVVKNGTAEMMMVMSITVPPHGSVSFQPGGYHLMCMQPAADLRPGHSVPVSLMFKGGATVSATFPVYGAKGK